MPTRDMTQKPPAGYLKYGLKSRIIYKATKEKSLSAREKMINAAISKTRYRVALTFGSMRRWFRGGLARYAGLAKHHDRQIIDTIAYNLEFSTEENAMFCSGLDSD